MNILVIKTTSLGDVLHSTPHLRAIREQYPAAHITLLTATASAGIYRHNPVVDRMVLFDHARFKQLGLRSPVAALRLIRDTMAKVNDRDYALAFDLQGLLRTVIFLYGARAGRKFVKGRWPGLGGFRDKQLHAIDEMTQVQCIVDDLLGGRPRNLWWHPYSEPLYTGLRGLVVGLFGKGVRPRLSGMRAAAKIITRIFRR